MARIKEDVKRSSSTKPNTPAFDLAVRHTFYKFKLSPRAELLHLNDVFNTDLNIWNESPGLQWKELGYETKGDIRNDREAINRVRKFWHLVKSDPKVNHHDAGQLWDLVKSDGDGDIAFPDCCVYAHKEEGEFKVKAGYEYPATITFGEAVFAVPLIEAYQYETSPIAYEFEAAKCGERKLVKRFSNRANYAVIEFKNFANSIPEWLIRIAFDILCLNIDFRYYRYYGIPHARRMYWMYLKLTDYFINTKIRLPNGRRFVKHGGLANGSYFRQLVDSVANHILLSWYSIEKFGRAPDDILVMGTNALVASDRAWNLKDFDKLMSTVGLTVDQEKSQISKKLHKLTFLGYKINSGTSYSARHE